MARNIPVEELANEICWALAANLGPNTDCCFLEKPIEKAVWLCVMAHSGEEAEDISPAELAARIRIDVESILESYHMDRSFLAHVATDIEHAARYRLEHGPSESQSSVL